MALQRGALPVPAVYVGPRFPVSFGHSLFAYVSELANAIFAQLCGEL